MKIKNIDLLLVRENMLINRKQVNVSYTGVNCYAHALNLSLLPESLNLKLYNVGCFSGKNIQHIKTKDVIKNLKSDLKALKIKYKETIPTFSLIKDNSWKIIVFVKLNKNSSFQERLNQIGGPNEVRDIHFIKMQDNEYSSKDGYNKPVKSIPYKHLKKELKRKGYNYVKTYKLTIK